MRPIKTIEELWEQFRIYRHIREYETLCSDCGGSGYKVYASTATWWGGIGGAAMTSDVCDKCWGSGIEGKPWPSHREYHNMKRRPESEKRFVIRTKNGYVTTSKGYFSKDLKSARIFKTHQAASQNRYIKDSYLRHYYGEIVPVEIDIKRIY